MTTANMTHSPLPWKRWENRELTLNGYTRDYAMIGTEHCPVAVVTGGEHLQRDEENAKLICAAVNSHQGLVEALQGLVSALEGRVHSQPALNAIETARAALNKIENERRAILESIRP